MDEKTLRGAGGVAEVMAVVMRRSYSAAVNHAFDIQKSNIKLSRTFVENWLETLEEGAESNRRALRDVASLVREQQRVLDHFARESLDAYDGFLGPPSTYEKEAPGKTEDAES